MFRWLRKRWDGLTLAAQFSAAATLVICILMAALATWVNRVIETRSVHAAAEGAAIYIESFLEPLISDLPKDGPLSPQTARKLDGLVESPAWRRNVLEFKIWRPDGTLLYGKNPELLGKRFESAGVAAAASGQIHAEIEHDSHAPYRKGDALPYPLIEVYFPLRSRGSGEITAVAEVYEGASALATSMRRARLQTAFVVGVLTFALIATLYLIVQRGSDTIARQRRQLYGRLKEAKRLAKQNSDLRRAADEARLAASQSNEELLSRIGADLHDGPIQILSLLLLRLDSAATTPKAIQELAQLASDTLIELRNISAGLILPEIEGLNVEETVRRAVERHTNFSGSDVAFEFEGDPIVLPEALNICIYRIVQEGLNNAFRHAQGRDQKVRVRVSRPTLTVDVSNGKGEFTGEGNDAGDRLRLGLSGLRNRVSSLKGSLELLRRPDGGAMLRAVLPLDI